MSVTPRAFLSYARKDGEVFATALRRRLEQEQPEVTLWQDRAEIEGGVGWWAQIEAALDRVQFLVIVLTPDALRSEMTRREWRYARQRGVNVYPVKGVPDKDLDYASLPKWMSAAHFYDVGRWTGKKWIGAREWETFVLHLKSDRRPPRVPFLAPDLPGHFVPRVREFDEVLRLVLAEDQTRPTTLSTALHGSGGYGKTSLAIALCHDDRVMEAFHDGVLWTSLGQHPNVRDELARWYDALTGSRPAFLDESDAALKLAQKLDDRRCLLVIDDVWDRSHLEPFLRAARACARIVTTRRLDLLAGAPRVRVDEMTGSEAKQLLGTAFDRPDILRERLARLAQRPRRVALTPQAGGRHAAEPAHPGRFG